MDPAVGGALIALGGVAIGTIGGVWTQLLAGRAEAKRLAQQFRLDQRLRDDAETRDTLDEALAAAHAADDTISGFGRAMADVRVAISALPEGTSPDSPMPSGEEHLEAVTEAAGDFLGTLSRMTLARSRLAVRLGPWAPADLGLRGSGRGHRDGQPQPRLGDSRPERDRPAHHVRPACPRLVLAAGGVVRSPAHVCGRRHSCESRRAKPSALQPAAFAKTAIRGELKSARRRHARRLRRSSGPLGGHPGRERPRSRLRRARLPAPVSRLRPKPPAPEFKPSRRPAPEFGP